MSFVAAIVFFCTATNGACQQTSVRVPPSACDTHTIRVEVANHETGKWEKGSVGIKCFEARP